MGNSRSSETQTKNEEIMIMGTVSEILKFFVRETLIIWHDPNSISNENITLVEELRSICENVNVFADWHQAALYLKGVQISSCHIITSGKNGESFVKEISEIDKVFSIHIFCRNTDYHKKWANQYPKVVSVNNEFKKLLENINQSIASWQKTKSSLRVDLPAYAPIFDDIDKSENNYLHLYLRGFVNFKNREQSKKDFLTLCRALYGGNKDIEDFEREYTQYNMKSILNWYTKECFLYKVTNNCLRIATADSIQYCRLVLRDLEMAIKEKYQQQSKYFGGLLYRGAYISNEEWIDLTQNRGKDIEMNGFLSTTKEKSIALEFCMTDVAKKAMITIIVPNAPDKGEQGFAEVKEYSIYDEEDEVLFNVRSRFTILEASIEEIDGEKCRHLVLLYGAQAIRKYMTLNNPVIQIQINKNEAIKCQVCKFGVSIAKDFSLLFVNLSKKEECVCIKCLKEYRVQDNSPLLCISPFTQNSTQELEGFVINYQEDLDISFYGYSLCKGCETKQYECCYKCLTCQENPIYCENCFYKNKSCFKGGHSVILESYPFSFWSNKMTEKELYSLEYHQHQLEDGISKIFQQAQIFHKTHNYEKAAQYYLKFLDQNKNHNNAEAAISFNNLGLAYDNLGEYQKAIKFYLKAIEIEKQVFGDQHPDTAKSYNNLGLTYYNLGEHQKAIDCYLRALEIQKAILGDDCLDTVISYNNLGLAHDNLGEYEKAIEFYLKALEIQKEILGDDHPDTAKFYNNLGLAYDNLEDYQKAIEFYFEALEIKKTVLGEKHPDTATSLNNLAGAYYNLGEYKRAIEFYLKALEIQKSVLGEKHPDTAKYYNNLGLTYFNLEEYEKAIEFYKKAFEIQKGVLGDKHPNTLATYDNIQLAHQMLGKSI